MVIWVAIYIYGSKIVWRSKIKENNRKVGFMYTYVLLQYTYSNLPIKTYKSFGYIKHIKEFFYMI